MKLDLNVERVINATIAKYKKECQRIMIFKTRRSDQVCIESKKQIDSIVEIIFNEIAIECKRFSIKAIKGYISKNSECGYIYNIYFESIREQV
ncbi:hypothetical protein DCO58_11750 [Helicobacter saguini]|uniref:Na+-translocating membrane potential-generating system MpsC domain-containing protein n=1 Tax=Helicobacter saguini TaxID=1548018 RepID=A0A347VQ86_9HELI|nr:hypothetical protein [Helicobacter saguini]MWV61036.1 hypothetical protein [Helicobacter saguini]MWV68295.1 hypothetical protein [Helicobacter saguini]MWV70240.1 hypothetical protein [Helicobacter saguini]MWV72143.1 hypothetical protein [Helicobacter saguini]TLD95205.1 hypothetical protein LS64_002240 [Helicobacter saguini]